MFCMVWSIRAYARGEQISIFNDSVPVVAVPAPGAVFWRAYSANWGAVVGLALLLLLLALAFFVPSAHDPLQLFNGKEQLPPMWVQGGVADFMLGTDDAGRDTWSRLVHGARYSLMIGLVATLMALVLGVALGLAAAFWPRSVGVVVVRVTDVMLSYPSLLLAMAVAAILGPSLGNTVLTIALVGLPPFVKLTRAAAMAELEKDYVLSAQVVGAGHWRLMFVTVLPNCIAPLIVQATLGFSNAILEAGAIGFLGFGVQPPDPEWGAMLGNARQYVQSNVWMAIFPGIAVFLASLSVNLVGDGLRDALDPRMRREV